MTETVQQIHADENSAILSQMDQAPTVSEIQAQEGGEGGGGMLEEGGVDGQGDHGMAEDILSNCNQAAAVGNNNDTDAEVIAIVNEEDEEEQQTLEAIALSN